MRVRLTAAARRELKEIFVYWAERANVEVADKLIEMITERFSLPARFPEAGRRCEEIAPGVRSLPAGDYIVYYRKVRSTISILHILHGARDQRRAFQQSEPQ